MRYSLRTLLLTILLIASATTVWWRWHPWKHVLLLKYERDISYASLSHDESRLYVTTGKTWPYQAPFGFDVWNPKTGEKLISKETGKAMYVGSSNERWILVHTTYLRQLADPSTAELLPFFRNNQSVECLWKDGSKAIVYNPDSKKYEVVELPTGSRLATLADHSTQIPKQTIELNREVIGAIKKGEEDWWLLVSPDEQRVVGIQDVRGTCIWDTVSGNLIAQLPEVGCYGAFSEDSRRFLARRGHREIVACDAKTGSYINTFQAGTKGDAGISHDSKKIVVSLADRSANDPVDAHVYAVDTGQHLATLSEVPGDCTLWFSPDDAQIVAWSNGKITTWNVAGGKPVSIGEPKSEQPRTVKWSADGALSVLDSKDRSVLCKLVGPAGKIVDASITNSGTYILCHTEREVHVWERRREESSLGVLILPELWLAFVIVGILVWTLRKAPVKIHR
jgi:hypothetical protein